MSIARSRQLPLRRCRVWPGSWISFRAAPRAEGPVDGLRHIDQKVAGVGRPVRTEEAAAQ